MELKTYSLLILACASSEAADDLRNLNKRLMDADNKKKALQKNLLDAQNQLKNIRRGSAGTGAYKLSSRMCAGLFQSSGFLFVFLPLR